MNEKINLALNKAKSHISIIFFMGGFIFDVFTLNRIDQIFLLIQQGIFLLIILFLLHFEIREQLGKVYHPLFSKYKTYAIHFFFGALLSAFLIFYFLSASGLNSFFFILVIIALMIINELPAFHKLNVPFKTTLFSICLISYLAYLTPTLIGYMGLAPLLLSSLIFFVILFINCIILDKFTNDNKIIYKYFTLPSLVVLFSFIVLHFLKIIPPVPLSIKNIGIYRSLNKIDGSYQLSYSRHPLKFWVKSEEELHYTKGEKIYCFASIFSPTKFHDKVLFQWYTYINNEWIQSDSLPISITGGRDSGFRAFTFKKNMAPGKWRIKILTLDQREIGRYTFNVIEKPNTYKLRTITY